MSDLFTSNKKKTGAVEIIIIINVILLIPYFFRFLFLGNFFYNFSHIFLCMNVNIKDCPCVTNGAIWQPITAIFMHANFSHLFFNMYALYIFGKPLEKKWGSTKFVFFYLTVGVLANIASVILFILSGTTISLLGASGAVFGVLLAFGVYFSETRLLLFFIIPLKVKWCILLYAIIELASEIGSFNDGIAHITHLFGFLFAFLYLT